MNKTVSLILLCCATSTVLHSAEKTKSTNPRNDFLHKNATVVTKAICANKALAQQVLNTVHIVEKYKPAAERQQTLLNALELLKASLTKYELPAFPYPLAELRQANNEIAQAMFRVAQEVTGDDDLGKEVLGVVKKHVQKKTERRKSLDDALKTLTELQRQKLFWADEPESDTTAIITPSDEKKEIEPDAE